MKRLRNYFSLTLLIGGTLLGEVKAQEKMKNDVEIAVNREEAAETLNLFKHFALTKNTEGLRSLIYEGLHDKEFIDNAVENLTANTPLRSKVLKLKKKHIRFQPNVPQFLEDIRAFPGLFYVEIYTKRRKGMDSIDGFYFAQIDGKYRIVYYLIAG